MGKEIIFHAPPKAKGLYSQMLEEVTQNEPKTQEEQNKVLSLLQTLISDNEIPYEEKMSYLFAFCQEVMSHSYGLFPKNSRSEE
jgi:hypothetical protein